MALTSQPVAGKDESVLVLTLGEVATQLGIGGGEVERMIAAVKLRPLETGVAVMVPVSEVEGIKHAMGRDANERS